MAFIGNYFVGFVTPSTSARYWNDEIREALRNSYNRETMDDAAFNASKAAHKANVEYTLALKRRRDQVIADVEEAKARLRAESDAIDDAVDAALMMAETAMTPYYHRVFQYMGLVPHTAASVSADFEDKFQHMEALRSSNLKAHCAVALKRRFGDDVKLVGDANGICVMRVLKMKKWITLTRLPKLPLVEWRQRLKDADVAAEVQRVLAVA